MSLVITKFGLLLRRRLNIKVTLSPSLATARFKVYGRREGKVPHILDLGNKWKTVGFTPDRFVLNSAPCHKSESVWLIGQLAITTQQK